MWWNNVIFKKKKKNAWQKGVKEKNGKSRKSWKLEKLWRKNSYPTMQTTIKRIKQVQL